MAKPEMSLGGWQSRVQSQQFDASEAVAPRPGHGDGAPRAALGSGVDDRGEGRVGCGAAGDAGGSWCRSVAFTRMPA
ncbi:hypothetical protein CAG99_10365 [Streptomyces marincola]|uniref:Uncharacterized protein n=1 Tax=Streptomyces marincola TaxID=2878388 RepID=A0A1W7CWK8_9ACTN|nr:hypothetical protein CAG99_10365 [Streptomyces marincola]